MARRRPHQCVARSRIGKLTAAGLLLFACSAAGGAAGAALLVTTPHAELLNWTPSPVLVRQVGGPGAVKLPAGKAADLPQPSRGAIHVEVERLVDGARCWASVNVDERILVLARHGEIACEPLQGRRATMATGELRILYPSDGRETLR